MGISYLRARLCYCAQCAVSKIDHTLLPSFIPSSIVLFSIFSFIVSYTTMLIPFALPCLKSLNYACSPFGVGPRLIYRGCNVHLDSVPSHLHTFQHYILQVSELGAGTQLRKHQGNRRVNTLARWLSISF